jgi:hypothetical protein
MAILGLLLILASAGLAVDVVLRNTLSMSVDALGESYMLSPGWLFVAGVATGVIGLLGVSLLAAGMTRARRRRAAIADSRNSVQDLQAERDRLAVELERARAGRSTAHDDEPREIDLGDERRADTSGDYAAERNAAGDRRETVESGRHGLFHRRH